MKTLLNVLDDYNKTFIFFTCSFVVLSVSLVGFIFENAEKLQTLYLLPLVIMSWYGGKTAGFKLAAFMALLSLLLKAIQLQGEPVPLEQYAYTSLTLATYFLIALLIIDFRNVHDAGYQMANKDHLTSLLNVRSFSIELANEILRSIRYNHKFSLSYIDIDNFKRINDTLGHQAGDMLLQTVAKTLTSTLRETDIVARLGGDEFAIIFPETDQHEVKKAFDKALFELNAKMNNKKWNVSFSVGIVTFETLPKDIKEAVKIADELMYSVKLNKKNNVAFQVWQDNDEQ